MILKVQRVKEDKDSYMKCCRWCSYYKNGVCHNNQHIEVDDINPVVFVSEEGYLYETIEESIGSVKPSSFKELSYLLLGWNTSQKRVKEFEEVLSKCLDQYKEDLKEQLGEDVDRCYQNHTRVTESTMEIKDPENFYCNDWR